MKYILVKDKLSREEVHKLRIKHVERPTCTECCFYKKVLKIDICEEYKFHNLPTCAYDKDHNLVLQHYERINYQLNNIKII